MATPRFFVAELEIFMDPLELTDDSEHVFNIETIVLDKLLFFKKMFYAQGSDQISFAHKQNTSGVGSWVIDTAADTINQNFYNLSMHFPIDFWSILARFCLPKLFKNPQKIDPKINQFFNRLLDRFLDRFGEPKSIKNRSKIDSKSYQW